MYHVLVSSTVHFCTAVLTLLSVSLPAAAQGYNNLPCADRDKVLSEFSRKHKEAPAAAGIAIGGGLLELLTTEDGSTWTIIVSQPGGKSCLLAAGKDWTTVESVVRGPEL